MLEFKNVGIWSDTDKLLSFVVKPGEILAVRGGEGSGKTSLVNVVLGRWPVKKGYVTIDGEQVTVGSAPYFRRGIGYVPRDVDFPLQTVGDLVSAMIEISAARGKACVKQNVVNEMAALDIGEGFLDTSMADANKVVLKLTMVAMCAALGGGLLVVDEPVEERDERVSKALRMMADRGWAVVVTEKGDFLDCDRVVDL